MPISDEVDAVAKSRFGLCCKEEEARESVGETDTATIVEVTDSLSDDSVLILMGVVAVVIMIGVEEFRFGAEDVTESMAKELDEETKDDADADA